ncbi:MAG: FMN-binding protein [Nitrososphaerota archaeon]
MKKMLVSAVIIGVFALYIIVIHGRSSTSLAAISTQGGTPIATSPTTSSTTGTTPPGSQYKNGTYTGASADAQWGIVQVQAVVQNGKLADVKFLQYPNERYHSVEINSYAIPQLTTEAIQAQSAQVDAVSGATDTSFAFMQSLGDALQQAQA